MILNAKGIMTNGIDSVNQLNEKYEEVGSNCLNIHFYVNYIKKYKYKYWAAYSIYWFYLWDNLILIFSIHRPIPKEE